jgi:hypothetical protein
MQLTMTLLLLLWLMMIQLPKLQLQRELMMTLLTKPMPMPMPMKRPMKLIESTKLLLVSGRGALVRPRALASSPWFPEW